MDEKPNGGDAFDQQAFSQLAHQYLEDALDDAGAVELSRLIEIYPPCRKLLVDITLQRMALVRILREKHQAPHGDLAHFDETLNGEEADASGGRLRRPLTTADVEWFIREVPLSDAPPVPVQPLAPRDQDLSSPEARSGLQAFFGPAYLARVVAGGVLMTMLALVVLASWWPRVPAEAKVIALAQPRWHGAESLGLGDSLPAGKRMRLDFGAVELRFPGSATVVICGPAEFHVVHGGRLCLANGELTAHVPPRAAGFKVESPALLVTDFGTEFAISVGAQGKAQVSVLEGRVEVESPAVAADGGQRLALAAGDSVSRQSIGDRLVSVPAPAADSLPREISRVRAPLVLNGTGVGLQEGKSDPNWRITSVPHDPTFMAKRAVVTSDSSPYMRNDPAEAQWLSLSLNFQPAAMGMYAFEVDFDLDGFDPSTVSLQGRVAVDDAVRAVRLNGQDVGWQTPPDAGPETMVKCFNLSLDRGFVAGRNRLEFDVENTEETRMALRVALEGSGCLVARLPGD